jgi:hypothetical protein
VHLLHQWSVNSVQFFYMFKKLQLNNAKQEKIVGENYFLHQLAQEAYRSYILAYNSNAMKKTFNVNGLNFKVKCCLNSVRFVFSVFLFRYFTLPISKYHKLPFFFLYLLWAPLQKCLADIYLQYHKMFSFPEKLLQLILCLIWSLRLITEETKWQCLTRSNLAGRSCIILHQEPSKSQHWPGEQR